MVGIARVCRVCSINNKYYTGAIIYIRAINISRDGEQGKVKQEVVHLREHSTAESALEAWPQELKRLRQIGRAKKAKTLQRKLDKLQELMEAE